MASPNPRTQARIKISGHVQGVGFRNFACRYARKLGVYGYVRNLPDHQTVEVVAEGAEQNILEFLSYLKAGPPEAVVKNVHLDWAEPQGTYQAFRISP